jgi:hypothetical protein
MIYLLDVAKIVTIPLIPKALGLPRAICYSGLHFGPCKIRYSEVRDFSLSLHSLNHDLFSAMDVHARLRRPSAYLEALEGVPVGVVVGGGTIDDD